MYRVHCVQFQDILKYTEKAGLDTKDLVRAVAVMHVVPKAANDMMNVGRLQGFAVSMIVKFLCIIEIDDALFYPFY